MIGDVWLEKKGGRVILCIGIGDGEVSRKDITDRFKVDKADKSKQIPFRKWSNKWTKQ